MTDVLLIKLGGSLITDKRVPETARPDVIRRVAGEIRQLVESVDDAVVVGHGSGSFGHVAAERYGVDDGLSTPEQRTGIDVTQERAAALHSLVRSELHAAGLSVFSVAPSSAFVAAAGEPAGAQLEPVALALGAGLVPVVYGDVVLDRERGCTICSTETVFASLVAGLPELGYSVRRIFWLGETAGILDAEGRTIERVSAANAEEVRRGVGGAAGTDVTGGMSHRLEVALELARSGVASWILDGSEPGALARALAADAVGTVVEAASGGVS